MRRAVVRFRSTLVYIFQNQINNSINLRLNKDAKITTWPLVLITAKRNKLAGACRLWMIARYLDKTGSGWVERDKLQDACLSLELGDRSYRRWLTKAIEFELLIPGKNDRLWITNMAKGGHLIVFL